MSRLEEPGLFLHPFLDRRGHFSILAELHFTRNERKMKPARRADRDEVDNEEMPEE
jgi:hypothetical protein